MPLERIDDRRDAVQTEPESPFLLLHCVLQSYLLTHCQSQPRHVQDLQLKGGVISRGGDPTPQITALSASYVQVQARQQTRRTITVTGHNAAAEGSIGTKAGH